MKPFQTTAFALTGLILSGGLLASPAMAEFTPVSPPGLHTKSHEAIFENFYGGDFVQTGGNLLSFTNGSITATRVDDDDDQTFTLGTFNAIEIASFAALSQTFGYKPGEAGTGGMLIELLDVAGGENDDPANITVGPVMTEGPIRFVRSGANGMTGSSAPSENAGGADRLVTYAISGPGISDPTFGLFFEDRKPGGSDEDFNDLVVIVSADPFTVVPTPSAAFAGLGLLGLVGLRRRRNRA